MLGQRKVKCVCVGDAGVGKSSLLMAFATNSFLADTIPALCRNYNISIVVNEVAYNIGLYDTQSGYVDRNEGEQSRIATYKDANVVLLCYSAVNKNSFDNITARWAEELQTHLSGIPVVLVCTNTDLRRDDGPQITHQEGTELKEKIGAVRYLECSSSSRSGLREVFEAAVKCSRPSVNSKKTGRSSMSKTCAIQ